VSAFSFFGSEASASITADGADLTTDNSQNMDLLQANVSSAFILAEKKGVEAPIEENSNLNILSDNALLPVANPLGVSDGTEVLASGGDFEGDIEIYVVHAGDTVAIVADMFGVSADTILSANNMTKGDKLKVGDVLLILPYSGVEHTVVKGETLQGLANKYKVDMWDILSANDLDADAKIAIGEKIMIPGASLSSNTNTKPKSSSGVAKSGYSSNVPLVAGYFINPVPGAVKSRGVKPGHKGVDLAASTGTPIKAMASGVVLIARNGYNGGFGNYVVVQHPNGVKTLYAHMSRLGTTPGAQVSQGQTIGYVGNTGRSTGPHLHFEVLGAKNPF